MQGPPEVALFFWLFEGAVPSFGGAMATTFTNGLVTLADDLIFDTVILTDQGWMPVAHLDQDLAEQVLTLLGNNPTCPQKFRDAVTKASQTQLN